MKLVGGGRRGWVGVAALACALAASCSAANPFFDDPNLVGGASTGSVATGGADAVGSATDGQTSGADNGVLDTANTGPVALPQCDLSDAPSDPATVALLDASDALDAPCGQTVSWPGALSLEAGHYYFYRDDSGACVGTTPIELQFYPKGPAFPAEKHCATLEATLSSAAAGCEVTQLALVDEQGITFFVMGQRLQANGTPITVGLELADACDCVQSPPDSCCQPAPGIHVMTFETSTDALAVAPTETGSIDAPDGRTYEVYNGQSVVDVGCQDNIALSYYIRTPF